MSDFCREGLVQLGGCRQHPASRLKYLKNLRSRDFFCIRILYFVKHPEASSRMTELTPPGDCLLVFLDEVGHEAFAGNQHYFGYGGCEVMLRDYERL